jgi:hypothetical protein
MKLMEADKRLSLTRWNAVVGDGRVIAGDRCEKGRECADDDAVDAAHTAGSNKGSRACPPVSFAFGSLP